MTHITMSKSIISIDVRRYRAPFGVHLLRLLCFVIAVPAVVPTFVLPCHVLLYILNRVVHHFNLHLTKREILCLRNGTTSNGDCNDLLYMVFHVYQTKPPAELYMEGLG